jgi:Transposase C of IS166 homeodomain
MATPEQMIAEYPLLLQRVAALEAQLAWFQKQVFGGGKREKLDPNQRQLDLAKVDEAREAVVDRMEKIAYERSKRALHQRLGTRGF